MTTKTQKYVRPTKTYTDNLSPEQIKEKLADYVKIDNSDLLTMQLGTHLRYFTTDDNGKKHFRMGGNLINIKGMPEYVILGNGTTTWSVQIANTIFFKKLNISDVREEYQEIIKEQKKEIDKLKKIISTLKESPKTKKSKK